MDANDIQSNVLRAALILKAKARPFTRWSELKQSERDDFIKEARRVLEHLRDYESKWWHVET